MRSSCRRPHPLRNVSALRPGAREARAGEHVERVPTRIIKVLVSDYERDKLRLSAEIAVVLARALEVTANDELLAIKEVRNGQKPSRRTRRLKRSMHYGPIA